MTSACHCDHQKVAPGPAGRFDKGISPRAGSETFPALAQPPTSLMLREDRMQDEKHLSHDPLSDAEPILRDDFYGRSSDDVPVSRRSGKKTAERPTHYKVICISMYTQDLEDLDIKIGELKRRGWTKANKSQLIRLALAQLDLDKLPVPRQ
jgi:hypothetical protein